MPTRYLLEQKITPLVNRYTARLLGPDDQPGDVIAFIEQKRFAFKERFTAYTREGASDVAFTVQARQAIDIGATYDVADGTGAPLGQLRKVPGRSLFRSTWEVTVPGMPPLRVQESSLVIALVRRVVDLPLPLHFRGAAADGPVVFASDRRMTLRDSYRVEVSDDRLDGRVALALAVCLDAMQGR